MLSNFKNKVLYFTKPLALEIKEEPIPTPGANEVLIKTEISAISAGTELLFYQGLMPDDIPMDMTIPALQQPNDYPLKYGYSCIGKIIATGSQQHQNLLNQWVFAFNPHESFFCAAIDELILLPKNLSAQNAVFLPNMETAINLILDSTPLIGENVVVLGLGIVGLLTTSLLHQFPIGKLIGIDFHGLRRKMANNLGADLTFDPALADWKTHIMDNLTKDSNHIPQIDLIYELSGNPDTLNAAIALASFEAKIILGSWYGKKAGNINLGGKFHRHRIKLIASQVSTIASELQSRWTSQRRRDMAFTMLQKIQPQNLISHSFPIVEAEKAYQLLTSKPQETLQLTLTYED